MKTIIILVLIGLAAADTFQHKVMWRESEMIKMMKRGEWATFLETKEKLRAVAHKNHVLGRFRHKVLDYHDMEYVVNITIGTPDQTFAVLPDTGSTLLWVPSVVCLTCLGKRRFNPILSSTYIDKHHKFEIEYVSGEVEGTLAEEIVRFGDVGEHRLTIPKTTFGLATHIFDDFEARQPDGVLGLGMKAEPAHPSLGDPPIINAIKQHLLDQRMFTVFLARRGNVEKADGGVFTYGAIDTTNCEPNIVYEPLTSESSYQFIVSSFKLGSFLEKRNYQVVSDTGSAHISGPPQFISAMAKEIGARYNQTSDDYLIDCNKQPQITLDITIGGNIYSIQPKNYIVKLTDTLCLFTVSDYTSGGFGATWILGTPFIRQYCNIYDIGRKRIGFTPSIQP